MSIFDPFHQTETSDSDDHSDAGDTITGTQESHDAEDIDDDGAENEEVEVNRPQVTQRNQRRGVTPREVRRIAAKHAELLEAETSDVDAIAELLGVSPDPLDLTVAIMTAHRSRFAPLVDLQELAEMDPMTRAINVMGGGRRRIRSVWDLLVIFKVLSGDAPSNDMQAAQKIGTAQIDDSALERSLRLQELAKKS